MWYLFGKPKESSPMTAEGNLKFSIVFFSTPNFELNVLFWAFSWSLLYYGGKIICSDIVFQYFACIKALINKIGYSYIAGGTHSKLIIKSSKKNRYDCIACSYWCDHTSTNAPDPIKTPQLRVLCESSTRMGDLPESPRVASLFIRFSLFCFVKNVWLYNF